jgi:drug/metabolite transporter (DMT)-like permease
MMLSLQVNTLSLHTIILLTSPFWASLLGYLLNGERIQRIDIIAIVLCFIGVVGCAFAGGMAKGSSTGIFIAFAMAWAFSACNIFNRQLQAIPAVIIGVWMSIISSILAGLFCAAEWLLSGQSFGSHSNTVYMLLLVTASLDLVSMQSMAIAFQNDSS